MPTATSIMARIGANNTEFMQKIRESDTQLKRFADEGTGQAGRLSRAFSGIGSVLGTVGKAAAGLTVGGLAAAGAGLAGAAFAGLNFNNSMEMVAAQLNAFTKDGAQSAAILDMIRERASKTPFAFEEMAQATAALLPASKASGVALEDLIKQAEILAASNPAQGMEGAAFSLKEALGGDFTSIVERFNLPRQYINQLKKEGVPAMEAVGMAMQQMGLDADLVTNLAGTMTGRWSTFKDTLTGLAATATAPLFEGLSTGLGDVQGLLDANSERLNTFATAVGSALGEAFQTGIAFITDTAIPAFQSVSGFVGDVADKLGLLGTYLQTTAETGDALNDWLTELPGPLGVVAEGLGRLVAAFAEAGTYTGSLPEQLGAAVDTLLGFTDAIGPLQAAGQIFSDIGTAVGGLVTALSAGDVAGAFEALTSGLATIGTTVQEALLPALAEVGARLLGVAAEWAPLLGQWVLDGIPILLENLVALRAQTMEGITTLLPQVLETFGQLIAPATQWVLDALPGLLENLGIFIQALIEQTMTYVPQWIETLAQYGLAAVSWIAERLPELVNNLGQFSNTMINFVVEQLPIWGTQLATLGAKLGQWVLDALPGLATNLGLAAGNLLAWVAQTAIDVVPKLAALGVKFTAWVLTDVLPALPGVLATIAEALWTFVTTTATTAGPKLTELANKFLDWIQNDVLPTLPTKLGDITASIGTWITDTALPYAGGALVDVGSALVGGIQTGITNAWESFTTWVTNQLALIPEPIRLALGISSPSRLMADRVGKPLMEGVAWGAAQALPATAAAITGTLLEVSRLIVAPWLADTERRMAAGGIGAGLKAQMREARATADELGRIALTAPVGDYEPYGRTEAAYSLPSAIGEYTRFLDAWADDTAIRYEAKGRDQGAAYDRGIGSGLKEVQGTLVGVSRQYMRPWLDDVERFMLASGRWAGGNYAQGLESGLKDVPGTLGVNGAAISAAMGEMGRNTVAVAAGMRAGIEAEMAKMVGAVQAAADAISLIKPTTGYTNWGDGGGAGDLRGGGPITPYVPAPPAPGEIQRYSIARDAPPPLAGATTNNITMSVVIQTNEPARMRDELLHALRSVGA